MGIFGNRADRRRKKSLSKANLHVQNMHDSFRDLKATQDELERQGDASGAAMAAEGVALAEKIIRYSEQLLADSKVEVPPQ